MIHRKMIFAGLMAMISVGCSPEQAIVEGKVDYFPPLAAIGGEADPFGFILTDVKWVSGKPNASGSPVYLIGQVDSSYLQKRIQVIGSAKTVSVGGVETPRRTFPEIQVERISILP